MSTSANRSPLLISVDTRNSHVLKHPYRVNLFKVSMSVRLKLLENDTIDKKVWCNMMDLFTKTYIQAFGSSDSVFADYFRVRVQGRIGWVRYMSRQQVTGRGSHRGCG